MPLTCIISTPKVAFTLRLSAEKRHTRDLVRAESSSWLDCGIEVSRVTPIWGTDIQDAPQPSPNRSRWIRYTYGAHETGLFGS